MIGLADAGRRLNQSVEHRLEVEGGAADDLEHVASRGLVFESFLQFSGALARLIEQPGVLHRDDRLRGEVLQQRDLLLGEGAYLATMNIDDAEQRPFLA